MGEPDSAKHMAMVAADMSLGLFAVELLMTPTPPVKLSISVIAVLDPTNVEPLDMDC